MLIATGGLLGPLLLTGGYGVPQLFDNPSLVGTESHYQPTSRSVMVNGVLCEPLITCRRALTWDLAYGWLLSLDTVDPTGALVQSSFLAAYGPDDLIGVTNDVAVLASLTVLRIRTDVVGQPWAYYDGVLDWTSLVIDPLWG